MMKKLEMKRIGAAGIAASTVASGAVVAVHAAPAAALDCRIYEEVTNVQSGSGSFWYGNDFLHSVPHDSVCADIQIDVRAGYGCNEYRVRYFNPEETTGWKAVCEDDPAYTVIAENAQTYRSYRVESRYEAERFDVKD